MHPSIISPRNLVLEIRNLQTFSLLNPVAEINMENIHKIEKSISVKAYSTGHSLTFILEIPSIEYNIYDYIHIYSIPNKQNLTIIPLGSEEYAYIEEPCKKISDDTLLCNSLDSRSIEKTEDCTISLIKQQKGNCTLARMNLKQGKLQKIRENMWLILLTKPEIAKTQCGSKTEYRRIDNICLVTITEDCQINIMNRTLRTHSSTITVNEVIPLPDQNHIQQEEVQYELHLEDISLDNIHELMNKIKDVQEIDDSYWLDIMAIPSWPTLLLYIIIGTLAVWKLYKCRKQPKDISREDAPGSCKTSFHLKEGGVSVP
ncbi:unnamed protein product [Euphydryas editha]|uniref:Envelope protein n=1 Tax=Euphydryas editha TaxID=104508 RepID=A0AAU9TMQ1_EUPED|nr:unnamed protein product [Euphydryas editha]